jgi:hypothetical protein
MFVRHKVKRAAQEAAEGESKGHTEDQPRDSHDKRSANCLSQDVSGRGTQSETDSKFLGALLNEIGDGAENSDGDED